MSEDVRSTPPPFPLAQKMASALVRADRPRDSAIHASICAQVAEEHYGESMARDGTAWGQRLTVAHHRIAELEGALRDLADEYDRIDLERRAPVLHMPLVRAREALRRA